MSRPITNALISVPYLIQTKAVYQINGIVGVLNDGKLDLDARGVWKYFGQDLTEDQEEEMFA